MTVSTDACSSVHLVYTDDVPHNSHVMTHSATVVVYTDQQLLHETIGLDSHNYDAVNSNTMSVVADTSH